METNTSGLFRIDPTPHWKHIRKRVENELVVVPTGNVVYSEGESEEASEKFLFTEVWEGLRNQKGMVKYLKAITSGKPFLFLGLREKGWGEGYLNPLRQVAQGRKGPRIGAVAFSPGNRPLHLADQ